MADVRSMLRASREARRINHPHASYTSDGKLLCNLCETLIKSEAAWTSHLHSSSHTLRQSRANAAVAARPENGSTRKRKASLSESPPLGNRKRSKATFSPGVDDSRDDEQVENDPPPKLRTSDDGNPHVLRTNGTQTVPSADDNEEADPEALEALDRELAGLEAAHRKETAASASVTISAAPMTAEEIATQAREEQSIQRGKRDAELEAEKEDAARLLEDEFDEMEGLEERVRKLREKREALRKYSSETDRNARTALPTPDSAQIPHEIETVKVASEEEEEEEDDDDDFDDWQFGAK